MPLVVSIPRYEMCSHVGNGDRAGSDAGLACVSCRVVAVRFTTAYRDASLDRTRKIFPQNECFCCVRKRVAGALFLDLARSPAL